MSRIMILLMMLAGLLLQGCNSLPRRDPAFAPVPASSMIPPVQATGSIYQAGYDMRLFEDQTAKRVGDILTVQLQERTQAQKISQLDSAKQNNVSVSAPTIWGVASATILGKNPETSLSTDIQYEGEAQARQSNQLTGDITVSVVQVLPNGNLAIRGEKRVTLNQGDEFIRLSGIVRQRDITTSNTVLSSQVADATIMYTGNGAVADASKVGWFARIFLSPWFPF